MHFQCPRFGPRESLKIEENVQIWEMQGLPLKGEVNFIVKKKKKIPQLCELLRGNRFDINALEYSVCTDAIIFILGIRAWKHIYLWIEKLEKDFL